ncbi:two-component system response regulator YesN [Paenibacillus taihuensis]|uniref:Two-component system response regulator YesN n=1 Tax=Paenibacillus taihuensis TaxID=1156355 RepID=A0A3D9S4D0_9BACL|nr:response regulator [Paenibacillus taihuensis]REE87522.1 two-component system response regulator YesN [Paenibacillus taihuensis]
MKALIVDDEKHVRDAIKLLVPWAELGITALLEAADGQSAKEMIEREKPELIFTDMMMPVMNGVDLLRWIHNEDLTSKTIVISGYDDFHLARETIRFGGLDYILKPIEPDQLIKAVRHATETWCRENQDRKLSQNRVMELNQLKPVYWDKVFSQMIEEPQSYYSQAELLQQEFGLPVGTDRVRVAVLSFEGINPVSLRSFSSDEDLFYFTMMNISNEIVQEARQGYAFSYWNQRREIVVLLWDRLEEAAHSLNRMQEGFKRTLRTWFHFGLGGIHPFPSGLKAAYQEASAALHHRNLLEAEQTIHLCSEQESRARMQNVHLSDHYETFRIAFHSGQPQRIREAVAEWVRAAAGTGRITPDMLEIWRSEYSVMCSQWSKSWLEEASDAPPGPAIGEEVFALRYETDGRFSLEKLEQVLADDLIRFEQSLRELKQQTGNVIYEIKKYVETHYQREISLQDIANHFYLSREYISRKFKQELGENLSEYIGRIRIAKAQRLLENPNMRVVQIAQMVGYQDEKYFSKVFKKLTGMTPNEYRKGQQL